MNNTVYLGVSKKDITPKVGCQLYGYIPDLYSEYVMDNLSATSFVFKDSLNTHLIISTEVCSVKTEFSIEIREEIERKFGIKKENILLSSIHNHTGPNIAGSEGWGDIDRDYFYNIFFPGVISSVEEALENLTPVKMGVAAGESLVGINRREIVINEKTGEWETTLGQNEWGDFNPKMTVISFKDENDKTIATMVHYGCHSTGLGRLKAISRDWPGFMIDAIEKETGAVCAYFNGFEGDVGPRLSNGLTAGDLRGDEYAIKVTKEVGEIAAKDAVSILNQISSFNEITIESVNGELKLPLKEKVSLEVAKEELLKYPEGSINWEGKLRNYYLKIIDSYEKNIEPQKYESVPLTINRIGNVAFIGFPYETFSQIGMLIQKFSKIEHTLSLAITNGTSGYFPTQEARCRGGYEILMAGLDMLQVYRDDADKYMVNDTLKIIDTFKNTK